ncbi:MAG: ribosome small subunit-dependent GTPase A [Lachnospiraceae bacterium]|nr:ribosome small subunit-dependent GTPase A [Lachnospiraceae bacterium]
MTYGKIIKGVAGFYYVYTEESKIYECRARGVFRNENIKPLVGDNVGIDVVSEEDKTGSVMEILPRKNALVRPAVANVDQALVLFALAAPKPNFNLLDRFLILMEQQEIPSVICMNKTDLVSPEEIETFREIYKASGYPIFFFSAKSGDGMEQVQKETSGKTSTVAGPSGSGKSTLINLLAPHAQMETGELSKKIQRGKNTTRHAELITVDEDTFIVDTPGFSSLPAESFIPEGKQSAGGLLPVDTGTLAQFFPEFAELQDECRFRGCSHLNEPGCAVRAAVEDGRISRRRYTSYQQIYSDLQENKRY